MNRSNIALAIAALALLLTSVVSIVHDVMNGTFL